MSKLISLHNVVKYSSNRISSKAVSLDNFITTDNILQNKTGITTATNLPPQGNAMPAYQQSNILVGNIRPYLKKIWFADREGGCSADVLVFDVYKKYDPKYVYYSMFRDDFFDHVMRGSKGTKMPRGDKNQILDFLIPDFDITTQQQIASVLSSLDSKIALNKRINAELEAMAKTLYDYWFVQFDFPNAEGKPYKSSGGKMVWNEELKREIPEGWIVKNLFAEMDVQYGFPFSTEKFTDIISDKPVIRIRDILENSISIYTTEEVDEKYMLIQNDLLIGMDGNFHLNFWDKTGAYLNQRNVRIRSRINSEVSNFQAYFELSPYIKAREKNVSRTTVGHLSDKDLKRLFLISPDVENKFKPKQKFDTLLNKIILNRLENQQLSALRDWLLPMLMNGQVKVGDVEEVGGLMAAEPGENYK